MNRPLTYIVYVRCRYEKFPMLLYQVAAELETFVGRLYAIQDLSVITKFGGNVNLI